MVKVLVAWKSIKWITDAIEFVQGIIDPNSKRFIKIWITQLGVAIVLYGGKKLYDELVTAEKEGNIDEMTNIIKVYRLHTLYIKQLEDELEIR